MDSLSQFALGAAVGVAVMGRRTAVWKAVLWGGVLGTLPDLDALIDHGDPVRNMVLHRAETHALFWQSLVAVPVAAGLAALMGRSKAAGATPGASGGTATPQAPGAQGVAVMPGRQSPAAAQAALDRWRDFPHWLLTVWLVFVTHALLDAMTVYGTRLALPFSDTPYGVGSMFIIDPLYTLPLLVGLAGALAARGPRRWRWNFAGLALSTAYLGWSAAAQQHVEGVVRAQIAREAQGVQLEPGARRAAAAPVERVLVTPTAFNTVLWRVVLMRPDGYEEGFYSLLDGGRPVRYTAYAHDRALFEQVRGLDAVARIAEFSRGFFRVDERDGVVRITDLRMGQEPAYVFSFAVARRGSAPQPMIPPQQVGGRGDIDVPAALRWLWRRMGGEDIDPPR
jgi:inner membrane protein